MRCSIVLALVLTPFIATVSSAQDTQPADPGSQKCVLKQGGTPSDTGDASRTDPTTRGSKDCAPVVYGHTTITGSVFFDLNLNGTRDPDEEGIVSWQVQITGPMTQTATTDNTGSYSFSGLVPGSYTICVMPPAGWTQISPTSGPQCTGSNGVTSIGIVVNAPAQTTDSTIANINFGFVSQ